MQKWEYLTLSGYPDEYELNEYGKQGWELVCIVTKGSLTGVAYLKRPLNE